MLLSDLIERNAQTNARGLATLFRNRSHTWAQFALRSAKLAQGLRGLGVLPGDRVAILAHNSDRYTEFFFAVAHAGAVFVPINTRLAAPEIAYWLEDSASQVLFVDDAFVALAPDLAARISCLQHVGYIGEAASPPAGLISYEKLIVDHEPRPAVERRADDLVGIFYTGGTTGQSKGVMLSHRNLITNAYNTTALNGLERPRATFTRRRCFTWPMVAAHSRPRWLRPAICTWRSSSRWRC